MSATIVVLYMGYSLAAWLEINILLYFTLLCQHEVRREYVPRTFIPFVNSSFRFISTLVEVAFLFDSAPFFGTYVVRTCWKQA